MDNDQIIVFIISYFMLKAERIFEMTYCCGLRLKDGLVFISDTRTNAGVDHISVFKNYSASV